MRTTIPIFFIFFFSSDYFSQTLIGRNDIHVIETNYQKCLDKGENMYGCSVAYYNKMDSCLNIAYRQLINKLDATKKSSLQSEEKIWLKTRDEKFLQIERANKMEGRDGEMSRTDEKGDFVKERVLELIKRLEK